jgi:hypothetical protein
MLIFPKIKLNNENKTSLCNVHNARGTKKLVTED